MIGQAPNPPIILAIVSFIIANLEFFDDYQTALINLSKSFLLVWAYLEITQGVNLFRRTIGIVGIIFIVLSWIL